MTRASFPEIPQAALRNHAHPEQVERVWRRLELDVARPERSRSAVFLWAPALAAAIFGLGVVTGSRLQSPSVEVAAVAEPRAPLPLPGAGPAAEPAVRTAEQRDTPIQKRAHTPRTQPTGEATVTDLSEIYGEPSAVTASEPITAPAGPAEWERLAETGDFRAANEALEREGGFDQVSARANAGQLLELADIARASGRRDQAAQALKRLLSAYVSAPEAPLAAWTLGNLLEQAGDRAGAADAYATYRRLSPTGDFAEDAAARQVDAALSQGNLELGTRAMEEYAQNFPKGRRMAELRKRLALLSAPVDGAQPPASEPDDEEDAVEPAADAPATVPSVRDR
jgi:hypothetical protein